MCCSGRRCRAEKVSGGLLTGEVRALAVPRPLEGARLEAGKLHPWLCGETRSGAGGGPLPTGWAQASLLSPEGPEHQPEGRVLPRVPGKQGTGRAQLPGASVSPGPRSRVGDGALDHSQPSRSVLRTTGLAAPLSVRRQWGRAQVAWGGSRCRGLRSFQLLLRTRPRRPPQHTCHRALSAFGFV